MQLCSIDLKHLAPSVPCEKKGHATHRYLSEDGLGNPCLMIRCDACGIYYGFTHRETIQMVEVAARKVELAISYSEFLSTLHRAI
jgi:hypothetical protein